MKLPIHNDLVAAFHARDPARIADLYAADAVFVTSGRPPVEGRDAIEQVMREDLQDPGFKLALTDEKTIVSAAGDLAYSRGTFQASFTNPHTSDVQTIGGNYLQVLQKQDDGAWKVLEDISSVGGAG
jgi:uncharacterized protein (TIGR02246 family)